VGENIKPEQRYQAQLQHALQTAMRAEAAHANDALVTAALLHDLGHLLHDLGATPTLQAVNDRHEYRALPFLCALFPAAVLDAVKLHVAAKRYLCATQPDYFALLSPDSRRSLLLQGGVFSAEQASAFIALPGAADAVRLRLWDDMAKDADLRTPPLSHFLARAGRCALSTPSPEEGRIAFPIPLGEA